ncbi:hypothetical protein ACMTN4_22155 [Rhodococcus globerulus]|uniref:hypothetical protein n=1 Tax=Rhodococcus globerulus TaxID=33008 RepID=UPI0039EBB91B
MMGAGAAVASAIGLSTRDEVVAKLLIPSTPAKAVLYATYASPGSTGGSSIEDFSRPGTFIIGGES